MGAAAMMRYQCQPALPAAPGRRRLCPPVHTTDGCGTSLSIWIVVAGAALVVLSQAPDMGSIGWLTATASALLVLYAGITTVLAGIDGERGTAGMG